MFYLNVQIEATKFFLVAGNTDERNALVDMLTFPNAFISMVANEGLEKTQPI